MKKKDLPRISGEEFKIKVEKAWGDNNEPTLFSKDLKVDKVTNTWWKRLLFRLGFSVSFFTVKKR